jgi:flavin-binding protein dodecin
VINDSSRADPHHQENEKHESLPEGHRQRSARRLHPRRRCGGNGITETLLTGTTKTSVEAAAKAAVPGATIERVESDAEGATYEAHMTKAAGSHVTVKLDASFKVTGIATEGSHP